MMNFFRKHMRVIFFVVIIAFIGGIVFSVGGSNIMPGDYALRVNGEKVPMKTFTSLYNSTMESIRQTSEEMPTDEQVEQLKVEILQSLLQEEVFYQQSKEYGIIVSDEELRQDIQSSSIFQNNGVFDHRIYYSLLRSINMTPKEYEAERRKQIAGIKLRLLLSSSVKLFDTEYEKALKENKKADKTVLANMKTNSILNQWFLDAVSESKIQSNDKMIFGN